MNSKSLANDIEKIINNNELKNKLIKNLAKEELGNENEIEKLYHVIRI